MYRLASLTALTWLSLVTILMGQAAETAETRAVKAARGKVTLQVPADWTAKPPRSNIVEHEIWAPAAEGQEVGGRMTAMMAGGSVKVNLERWRGQIKTEVPAEVKEFKAAGQTVHLLDQRGTFMDRRGPFGPATPREDYRVMGAIIELESGGLFFLKFYGPGATIDEHANAFTAMLKSIEVN